MKRSNTIMIGVVYPGVEPFLDDYFHSLKTQNDSDFDLLIINDRARGDVRKELSDGCEIIRIYEPKTQAQIRQIGIDHALNAGYEYIIFSDTDDFFSGNRVAVSKNALKDNPFVFNELDLVDCTKKILKIEVLKTMKVSKEYDQVEAVLDRNIFGLSNTACRVSCLQGIRIPPHVIAVDWWLYTVLLLNRHSGHFLPEVLTYYRQTDSNIIGMNLKPSKKRLLHILEVRKQHYRHVYEYCLGIQDDHYIGVYQKKLREMLALEEKLRDDAFFSHYLNVIEKHYSQIYTGWWSEVLPLSQWSQYE